MSRSIIGNLRVHLGMDSAQFQAGLTNATKGIDRFAKSAAKIGAAVGAAITATTAVVSMAVRNAINEADNMAKAAQKFGVGVEELTRLKHAADLSGVSMDGLGTGIRVLSRNMLEFANGAKNSASQAFQQLGIEVKNSDGTMKSSSQVMTELAGKFSEMQDGAQKTALAMAVFGRSGADLIPMLNAGASGLAEMMAEADQLGIVIDTNTAKAAEAFNDNLTRLGRVKDGLIMKLTAELLPALEDLSEQFLALANDGEAVAAIGDGLSATFEWLSKQALRVVAGMRGVRAEIAAIVEVGQKLGNFDFAGARDSWNAGQDEAGRIIQEMEDRIANGVFSGTSQGQIQRRITAAFGEAGAEAGDTLLAAIETSAGSGAGRVRAAIDPMVREAERIFDSTRNSVENYHMQIARLNELLAAGAIDQDTYNRAVLQAQDAFEQAEKAGKNAEGTFQNIGQTIGHSFSSAFQGLIDGSKKVGDVLRDLMSQLTQMLMNQAFKALFSGGGSSSGGGFFSGLMGALGFRANGGPVMAGRPYIVGERGPELMIPGSSGSVVRNADLSRIGGGVHVTFAPVIDNRGASSEAVARTARELDKLKAELPARVTAAVRDAQSGRML